jgi:hypothetical protein
VRGIAACRFTLIAEGLYTGIFPPDEPEGRNDPQPYAADGGAAATLVGSVNWKVAPRSLLAQAHKEPP